MSTYIAWVVLSSITRSPLISALIVFGGYWFFDRATFQFLPSPRRLWKKWMRPRALARTLALNPNDRRARHELAEICVMKGRNVEAIDFLKANLEAGDDDNSTLFLLGKAYLKNKQYPQGEFLLQKVREIAPDFRAGEIELVMAQSLTERQKWKEAQDTLQTFLTHRPGSVRGHVLLAQAYEKQGEFRQANMARRDAWKEFSNAPKFIRRQERLWAYRAQPWRALIWLGVSVGAVLLIVWLGSQVVDTLPTAFESFDSYE